MKLSDILQPILRAQESVKQWHTKKQGAEGKKRGMLPVERDFSETFKRGLEGVAENFSAFVCDAIFA